MKKIHRNLDTHEGRAFWASAERIAAHADGWPASRRAGINVSPTRSKPVATTMAERNPETEAAAVELARSLMDMATPCYEDQLGDWIEAIRLALAAAEKRGEERGLERAGEVCDAWGRQHRQWEDSCHAQKDHLGADQNAVSARVYEHCAEFIRELK